MDDITQSFERPFKANKAFRDVRAVLRGICLSRSFVVHTAWVRAFYTNTVSEGFQMVDWSSTPYYTTTFIWHDDKPADELIIIIFRLSSSNQEKGNIKLSWSQ